MPGKTGRKKLTVKQKRFAKLYAGEMKGNGTQAAIQAGYSEKTARQIAQENLTKPAVAEAIVKAGEGLADIASVEEAQAKVTAVLRKGTAAERDVLKAAELIGKFKGAFVNRHELSGPGGGPLQWIMTLTPGEVTARLLELIAAAKVARKAGNDPA